MTLLQRKRVLRLIKDLVQRKINEHEYLHFRVIEINHCGGYRVDIYDVALLHDDDVLAIIAVCKMSCVQFQLYLNEGIISIV